MPVSKDQAEMIANLAVAARPTGARRWDAAGVMAAVGKVRHLDLAEVMLAAARAARDRDLETPGAIGNPSAPCWIERPVVRAMPEKTTPGERCGICAKPASRCQAERIGDDDHVFEPDVKRHTTTNVAATVAALKAEVAHKPTVAPTKTLDDYARNPKVQALRDALHPPELEESV